MTTAVAFNTASDVLSANQKTLVNAPEERCTMGEDYRAREGDCVSSIAFEHGFHWETLWNHANNAQLKQKRKNPNMLRAGDIVHIPDLTPSEETRATDKTHRFKLKDVPIRLCLRILELPRRAPGTREHAQDVVPRTAEPDSPRTRDRERPEPRSSLPYILTIDGQHFRGATSSDGMIEYSIPPNARDGRLVLEPGRPGELTILLKIGCLEPVDEIAGAQARLNNLGFRCGVVDGILGPRTTAALKQFQASHGLGASGALDDATKDRLREAHDIRC